MTDNKEYPLQAYVRPFLKKFVLFVSQERGESVSRTVSHMIEEYQKNNPKTLDKFNK
jgi:hypothetical protein